MAKKQSFGDKVRRQKEERVIMAKMIVAEKKDNGQYRFREKMVPLDDVQAEIKAMRN